MCIIVAGDSVEDDWVVIKPLHSWNLIRMICSVSRRTNECIKLRSAVGEIRLCGVLVNSPQFPESL